MTRHTRIMSRAAALLLAVAVALPLAGQPSTGQPAAEPPRLDDDATLAAQDEPTATAQDRPVERVAGADRVATAVALSRETREAADAVVLARADLYPDALSGAPLAAALDAPILLTASDGLDEAVRGEIARLGATQAVVLGGTAALSDRVVAELAGQGLDVERLGGRTREGTARLVAERVGGQGAYVVEGSNADPRRGWPDAVSVSALAAAEQRPILLATRDRLPEATAAALAEIDEGPVRIVGGTAAVSDDVEAAIAERVGEVERLAGDTRYATSRAVADRAVSTGFDRTATWLVSGADWPDALVAGPAAARAQAPVLLVHPARLESAPPARDWLLRWRGVLDGVRIVGGPAAVSEEVVEEVAELLARAAGEAPDVALTAADETGLQATVELPAPRLWEVEADGETYTEVVVAGIERGVAEPAQPAVPRAQLLVAVPEGAEVTVRATPRTAERHDDVLLLPGAFEAPDVGIREEPPPEFFDAPPFSRDDERYATDALYPERVVDVERLGSHRDLRLARVSVAAGRHNPVERRYEAYDRVDIDVRFEGGEGWFVTPQSLSLLEPASRLGMELPLNAGVVAEHVADLPVLDEGAFACRGEELLVLAHPDFRAAADDLADWKGDKGVPTTVVEVGVGTERESVEAITDLIGERYDSCLIRPSYVLLLGGVDRIPADTVDIWVHDDDTDETIVTDLRYGHLDPPDLGGAAGGVADLEHLLPDLITGRIPARTAAQARTAVDKIIAYESAPPADAGFYERTAHAGQFECCRTDLIETVGEVGQGEPALVPGVSDRTFIDASEHIRDAVAFFGYEPERLYAATTSFAYGASGADDTPRAYDDQTPLPDDLGFSSGFAWDAGAQDVIDAFDDGRFFVTHRDHGWAGGWSTPSFTTSHVAQTANDEALPVVWSINCSTARFDAPTPSLAESLLYHPDGGAVGVIGATGLSPSNHNTALSKGMADAVWPRGNPGLNPVATLVPANPRLGDMLHRGRLHMLSITGTGDATAGYVGDQYLLYHVIGDPTLEMWTAQPDPLPGTFDLERLDDRAVLDYDVDGAVVTLWQDVVGVTRPIGRGVVVDGRVEIAYELTPEPRLPLEVSISAEDRVDRRLTEPFERVAP